MIQQKELLIAREEIERYKQEADYNRKCWNQSLKENKKMILSLRQALKKDYIANNIYEQNIELKKQLEEANLLKKAISEKDKEIKRLNKETIPLTKIKVEL